MTRILILASFLAEILLLSPAPAMAEDNVVPLWFAHLSGPLSHDDPILTNYGEWDVVPSWVENVPHYARLRAETHVLSNEAWERIRRHVQLEILTVALDSTPTSERRPRAAIASALEWLLDGADPAQWRDVMSEVSEIVESYPRSWYALHAAEDALYEPETLIFYTEYRGGIGNASLAAAEDAARLAGVAFDRSARQMRTRCDDCARHRAVRVESARTRAEMLTTAKITAGIYAALEREIRLAAPECATAPR